MTEHTEGIKAVAYSPSGNEILSGDALGYFII